MKKKTRKIILGASIGFLSSLILLTVIAILFHTTITITLTSQSYPLLFKILVIIYSWPFMIVAFLANAIGLDIFNIPLLIILSSGTYTGIGAFIAKKRKHKK